MLCQGREGPIGGVHASGGVALLTPPLSHRFLLLCLLIPSPWLLTRGFYYHHGMGPQEDPPFPREASKCQSDSRHGQTAPSTTTVHTATARPSTVPTWA